jgi:uncharacterized DUF497 family protein
VIFLVVNIIWDEAKNSRLKKERGISFEEVATLILQKKYVVIVEYPKRSPQRIFLIPIHGYIHAVPFIFDAGRNIVLETAFPIRTFNRLYGERDPLKQSLINMNKKLKSPPNHIGLSRRKSAQRLMACWSDYEKHET